MSTFPYISQSILSHRIFIDIIGLPSSLSTAKHLLQDKVLSTSVDTLEERYHLCPLRFDKKGTVKIRTGYWYARLHIRLRLLSSKHIAMKKTRQKLSRLSLAVHFANTITISLTDEALLSVYHKSNLKKNQNTDLINH